MQLTNKPDLNLSPGPGPDLDAVFQALAHPVRRSILDFLREGDRTVGELAEPFHQSRPSISQHLDVLENAGLVQRIPSGRKNLCRLTGAPLAPAADWLLTYARYWTGAFDRMERHFLETPEP
jgi:DNA-binding transcriptional ArsR family regulator